MIPKIGETSNDTTLLGRRDAFHVTAVLVKSEENMYGGAIVEFVDEACTLVKHSRSREVVVDPFLDGVIRAGTLFWAYLSPTQIVGLRHDFDIVGKTKTPNVVYEIPANLKKFLDGIVTQTRDGDNECLGCDAQEWGNSLIRFFTENGWSVPPEEKDDEDED